MKTGIQIPCSVLIAGTLLFPSEGLAVLQDSTMVIPSKIQRIETFDDLPVGTIIPWASNNPLPGAAQGSQKWLPCDGQIIPGSSKFALLRGIVGGSTPNYNDAPNDNTYGVFLRGSRNPRLGFINADTTEKHTHEQKTHTHGFDLKVLKNYLTGETLSTKYLDGKRGWHTYKNDPINRIGAPFTMLKPLVTLEDMINVVNEEPANFADGVTKNDWGPEFGVPDPTFHQVKEEPRFLQIGGGEPDNYPDSRLDLSEMTYTTTAVVVGQGQAPPEQHWVTVGWQSVKYCIPKRDSAGNIIKDKDGNVVEDCEWRNEDRKGWVTCTGVNTRISDRVRIQTVDADNPDFLLRRHGAEDFMGSKVDKENDYAAGWGIFGIEDTMEDSALMNDVRITKTTVKGRLHEDGGDDSSYGYDLRSSDSDVPTDSQETMPAHTTVRYIIKALP